MSGAQLKYAIKFVADMDNAVKFYRDTLGLPLKFQNPGWSEFVTGETTLALHPASDKNPAGKVELGFTVADVETFYRDMSAKGVRFSMPPRNRTSAEFLLSSSIPRERPAALVQRPHKYRCSGLQAVTAPLVPQAADTKHPIWRGLTTKFTGFEVGLLRLPTSLPSFNPTSAELHRQDVLILHPHPRPTLNSGVLSSILMFAPFLAKKLFGALNRSKMPKIWTQQRNFRHKPVFAGGKLSPRSTNEN